MRAWDKDGHASVWSPVAHWSMGLLKPQDWQAQWIGLDDQVPDQSVPEVIQRANWIWSDANARQGTVPGPCYFRGVVHIPAGEQVTSAMCYITADDAF